MLIKNYTDDLLDQLNWQPLTAFFRVGMYRLLKIGRNAPIIAINLPGLSRKTRFTMMYPENWTVK